MPRDPAPGVHHYRVHGLQLASSLELADLAPAGPDAVDSAMDVEVVEGDVEASLAGHVRSGAYWQASAGELLFEVPGIARFLVSNGCTIRFQPSADQPRDEHAIRVYLLGTALGALLHQRGLFPLHAGGLATPSGAWLFTGHSGAGKSTLVAWLHRRFGWPILSDDVTVVDHGTGPLHARGGIPRLRLWRDALAAMAVPAAGLVRDLVREDKFQLSLGDGHHGPIPLRGLVLLESTENAESSLTRLRGHEALATVMGSVYRPAFAETWRVPGSLFLDSARIAAGMQVYRFSRPRNLVDYDRHLECLISGLGEDAASAASGTQAGSTNTATTG